MFVGVVQLELPDARHVFPDGLVLLDAPRALVVLADGLLPQICRRPDVGVGGPPGQLRVPALAEQTADDRAEHDRGERRRDAGQRDAGDLVGGRRDPDAAEVVLDGLVVGQATDELRR